MGLLVGRGTVTELASCNSVHLLRSHGARLRMLAVGLACVLVGGLVAASGLLYCVGHSVPKVLEGLSVALTEEGWSGWAG